MTPGQQYSNSIISCSADPVHGDQLMMQPEKGYWVFITDIGELAAISA
jgi:hypothetical protein